MLGIKQHFPIRAFAQLSLKCVHYFGSKPTILLPEKDYNTSATVTRSNFLVSKLCKEGNIIEARKLFDKMPDKDVVAWTSVIVSYIKCQMIDEASRLFNRQDAKKNVVTWTALLGGYVRSNRIKEAERLFHEMPVKNVVSWNTMIDGYARCGQVDLALGLFEKMLVRNVVSWNTMMVAFSLCGRIDDAQKLFETMPEKDVISWTVMITGLSRNGRIDEARVLFDRMPQQNVVSWNTIITGYAQNKRLEEAFELFERMPERDIPSWNAMITGFVQNGQMPWAVKLFNEMPQKNAISWTTMITGYIQDGQNEEALKVFSKLVVSNGTKPNEGTFVTVLSACSNLAGLCEGQQVHQLISKSMYQESTVVVSALINMYSKCGELNTARKMFDDGVTSNRDLVAWNGMIAAYAYHGCGMETIKLFNEMCELGVKPDDVTYVGLLSGCSHAGLVDEGFKYFIELLRDGSIQVRDDHYTCFVDLCGRAGRLKEAFDFIEQFGTKLSTSAWGALLSGCNVHGDINIGKLAAQRLLEEDPENAGTYMLLSNIYASSGKWQEAAKMRIKMKEKGLKKQPGCSWIEVGNMVHVFVVSDKSHCQSKLIYSVLRYLHKKMKKIGNSSNNDLIMEEDFSAE